MAPQGQGDTWTKKADMPTARHGLTASTINGKIYVMGGAKLGQWPNSIFKTLEEYDPITNTWTKKADMTTERARLASCAVNGKIYAIGGWPIHGTVEEYDPVNDKWTRKASMIAPSERLAVCELNGKIYAFGGWSGNVVASASEYDPISDTWTKKANLPEPAEYFSASGVNGKIYIIGHFQSVLEYDPIKDKYTPKAVAQFKGDPSRLYLHSATVISSRIYIFGGLKPYGNLVAVYDPKTDTWEEKADMPTARCWLATSEVNGKIYAIGGMTDDPPALGDVGVVPPLAVVEEYDTGFAGEGVQSNGKLPTTWGSRKSSR